MTLDYNLSCLEEIFIFVESKRCPVFREIPLDQDRRFLLVTMILYFLKTVIPEKFTRLRA